MTSAAGAFALRRFEVAPILDDLRAAERLTGIRQAVLHAKPPEAVAHVWGWFLELHRTREAGGRRLRWTEIEAWARLHGYAPLLPLEIAALKAFDDAYVASVKGSE